VAIWTHLEDRKIVKGSPQDSMKIAASHCEWFAQFIAIQTFDDDPQIGASEFIKARSVLESLGKGRRKINPVPVGNPFGAKDPRAC
jgi:predicted transcriptional regulator